MAEVIAEPDTDERINGCQQHERLGGQTVVAAVMRNLEHLYGLQTHSRCSAR